MKRWEVIIEIPAQQDIMEGHAWLARQEPDAADRWFNGLQKTISSLETFPERCPLAPESKFFNLPIRQIFHGQRQHKYRILFTTVLTEVHILHVRHGARLALDETQPTEEQ